MARPPELTDVQRRRLKTLDRQLKRATEQGDFERAKRAFATVREVLQPSGHRTALHERRLWLCEAALGAADYRFAEMGLVSIRGDVSSRTRLYLEATTLLAIVYLRQQRLDEAEKMMSEVFLNDRVIASKASRRRFIKIVLERFREEATLASLVGKGDDDLDPERIQREAGELVNRRNRDELYAEVANSLPVSTRNYLMQVEEATRRQLPSADRQMLPAPQKIIQPSKLGRTVMGALKRVLYRALCDPDSEIHQTWVREGIGAVLNKTFIGTSVASALGGYRIGIAGLASAAAALLIQIGIETFCEMYEPRTIMDMRGKRN